MTFKVKKIRKKKSKFMVMTWIHEHFGAKSFFAVLGVCLLAGVLLIGSAFLRTWDGGGVSRIMPKISLIKEDQHGHTNILLLGVAGEAEEGGNLTDSIMILSVLRSLFPIVKLLVSA